MKLYERIENNNFNEIDKNRAIELIENGNGHLIYNENYFKLQKENEELRAKWDKDTHILQNKLDYANADRIDLTQQNKELRKENEELKKDYYNVINKIENKIDILDIAISECIYLDDDDEEYKKAVEKDKLCLLNQKRALQELLEGGQS